MKKKSEEIKQLAPAIVADYQGDELMDNAAARKWLDTEWQDVLMAAEMSPDPEVDCLVDSSVVSIRYAVVTQILGKIADPSRSLLYLQIGSGEPGAWNARSFCDVVIVPWVADNHDVIGTSAEPYANKPLRRSRLWRGMTDVRSKDWDRLVSLFESLENASADELRQAYRRCLAAVARRLSRQSFKYPIPMRVSAAKTREALEDFLSDQSGGLRPMVVAAALMQVLGEGFSLFSRVESQGVNEADAASGVPGDVMCYADDRIVMAVEVKDRNITLTDVRSSTRKAQQADQRLSNFLFMAPGIRHSEKAEIDDSMERTWASGLNLYQVDLLDLAAISFVLLDEEWHPRLLRGIGVELDRRGDHEHRRAWLDILSKIAEATRS